MKHVALLLILTGCDWVNETNDDVGDTDTDSGGCPDGMREPRGRAVMDIFNATVDGQPAFISFDPNATLDGQPAVCRNEDGTRAMWVFVDTNGDAAGTLEMIVPEGADVDYQVFQPTAVNFRVTVQSDVLSNERFTIQSSDWVQGSMFVGSTGSRMEIEVSDALTGESLENHEVYLNSVLAAASDF